MMRVLPCEAVGDDLQAFHDGELPVDRQVRVEEHLRECVACRLEGSELAELRDHLRQMSVSLGTHAGDEAATGLTLAVLERFRIEEQFSVKSRVRSLFEDMHLVWAALGATLALIICLAGSVSVLHAANEEHPDSLAGIISLLANPGSNANPARLDSRMLAPRPNVDASFAITDEDAVFALSAVVTREGEIQSIELLVAEQARALQVEPEVVLAMLDAASRASFAPAQRMTGAPIAVSLIWLLANTTVRGQTDLDLFLESSGSPRRVQAPAAVTPVAVPTPSPGPAKTTPSPEFPLAAG